MLYMWTLHEDQRIVQCFGCFDIIQGDTPLLSLFYRTQVSLGSDLWVRLSLTNKQTEEPFADLTDVTLADEDTNSILTDNANRAIQGNVATILTLPC